MSKLDLTSFSDADLYEPFLSELTEFYRQKKNQFPEAIILSEGQAKKFFFANNELMTNYKGIPIELEKKTDERATVIKTIGGILSGMHKSNVKEVYEVYKLLEEMKIKIAEGKN